MADEDKDNVEEEDVQAVPLPPGVDKVIIGDDELQGISQKMLEDAAEDARILMAESPIIPKLVYVDIVARRLFLMVRSAIEQELQQGWDVENIPMVIQTLGMSAQEKAVEEPGTAVSIQQDLLMSVLPVVDIFVQMQLEHEKQENQDGETKPDDQTEILSGSDDGDADGVGEVLLGPTSVEEHQGPSEDSKRHQEEGGDEKS